MTAKLISISNLLRDAKASIFPKVSEEPGLTVVYSSKSDKNVIDIVAVHGLTRGFKSWTLGSGKDGSWLADKSFAEEVTKTVSARIMTFSYNPEALSLQFLVRKVLYGCALDLLQQLKAKRSEVSKRDETSTTRRPLIFIAHSLGGLIVKRALIMACESAEEFRDIELSTGGIVFFGTPDTDIPAESLETIIRKVATLSYRTKTLGKEDKDSVRNDTQWLKKELEAFKPISSAIKILSIQETENTVFTAGSFRPSLIVNGESVQRSVLGPQQIPDPGRLLLQKRHSSLIKFDGTDDRGYRLFMKRLRSDILLDAHNKAGKKWEAYEDAMRILRSKQDGSPLTGDLQVPSVIPHGVDMIARKDQATQVHEKLSEAAKAGHLAIMTIYGPAGQGKTTLARKYSQNVRDTGRNVFWLNAESRQTIITDFLKLGLRIFSYYWSKYYSNQQEDIERAKARLRAELGLPEVEKLLQTKDFNSMDPINVRSAVRAVKDWLLRDGNRWLLVYENIVDNFDLLEFMPLTVRGQIILITRERKLCPLSTTEIMVPGWCEGEALDLLKKHLGIDDFVCDEDRHAAGKITEALQRDPLSISCAATYMAGQEPKMTLQTYWSRLEKKVLSVNDSRLTLQILAVSSMLAVYAIPVELFLGNWIDQEPDFDGHKESSVTSIVSYLAEQNVLQRVSLQEFSSTEDLHCHRPFLLHKAAREWIEDHLLKDPVHKARSAWLACFYCVQIIKRHGQTGSLLEIQSFGRLIAPHAQKCYDLHHLLDKESLRSIEWHVLGNLCMTQGAKSSAIGCFKLAFQNTNNLSAAERTRAELSLATIYYEHNELSQCRDILEKIKIRAQWTEDLLDFRVHFARANIAAKDIGNTKSIKFAVEQFEKLEKDQDASSGPLDCKTLLALHQLASTLKSLRELERAEALYRRVMTSYRIKYGASDPMTLEVMEDLAHVLEMRGELNGAEELYRNSIEFKEATLGANHPNVAASSARLAAVLDHKYEFVEADKLYKTALGVLERTLGTAHPTFIATKENFALCLWSRSEAGETGTEIQNALKTANGLLQAVVETKEACHELYEKETAEASKARLLGLRREIRRRGIILEDEDEQLQVFREGANS